MIWISEEYVLSGAHLCGYAYQGNAIILDEITWILGTAWESLTLFLAVWIAVKHFRELQRPSSGWTVVDCFTILIKTHVFYFARFVYKWKWSSFQLTLHTSLVVASSVQLLYFSPKLYVCQPMIDICIWPFQQNSTSVAVGILYGILQFTRGAQMFILGPRLILGVREYHANLVANSDEGTGMGSIVFQERVHISTGSGV